MEFGLGYIGVGIAAGVAILGAALGIGRIGGSATEGISRQPEAGGKIQTAMIIAAALIEGAALFDLVIAFQAAGTLNEGLKATVAHQTKASAVVTEEKGK
ncbi:ATP synthase F0 subunit C [Leptospira interrogans]|uniref:ATP synthase F0 subunit C n=1 Tax=Leptospira interrogans TaxID=173 RepID=UPI00030E13E6|nr:ATP synthase F0 subunit C [Leptospira interrogans]